MLRTLMTLTLTATLMLNAAAPVFADESDKPSNETFPARHLLPKDLQNAPWLPKEEKSAFLPVLYVSYGALQAMDIRSTMTARQHGAQEVNPLMGSGKVSTMLAVKAATGAATILLASRMAKKNKKAAIATMIVANAITAAIVAHNYRNAARR